MDPRTRIRAGAGMFAVQEISFIGGVPTALMVNGTGEACQVPVSVLGGGGGALIYVPTLPGTRQVLVRGEGSIPTNYMAAASPQASGEGSIETILSEDFEAPENNEEYPDKASLEDIVLYRSGARIVFGAGGELVLQSKYTAPIRVQLASNGYLQVTSGDEATERAMLGLATLEVLQKLTDKLNSVGSQLADLASAIVFAVPNPLSETGFIAAQKGAANLDVVYTDLDAPGEELVAATLRLSPKTEVERKENNVEG